MIRRPPRSTPLYSSAASDVYKRQVLIPEPFGEKLVTSQIGVIWFQVQLQGVPVHVHEAQNGENTIEAVIPLIEALKKMEERWNLPEHKNCHYHDINNPLNLNIGKIAGGDW